MSSQGKRQRFCMYVVTNNYKSRLQLELTDKIVNRRLLSFLKVLLETVLAFRGERITTCLCLSPLTSNM